MIQCPKCKSRLITKNRDGDLECICGKVFYISVEQRKAPKKRPLGIKWGHYKKG